MAGSAQAGTFALGADDCHLTAFRRSNPEASLRIYCFPFAGAATWDFFRIWVNCLPTDLQRRVELWSVDVRGSDAIGETSPTTDLRALLRALVEAIGPRLVAPFAFFG